ncbi:phage integrase N-terminal SAM-like domain-containing protein [Pseudomonas zhanjiangensis]|uniref:Integrase SAM-like N-terminal domain-containing protein n=1 Tax=Pseudomonas zhanjiangensis TaxID=3239015 RepID=A0ABV3YTP0_9PSED
MGAAEVESFLSDLAVGRHVSASTQNQAWAAPLFSIASCPGWGDISGKGTWIARRRRRWRLDGRQGQGAGAVPEPR